jgi:Beta-galactosidase jelly roll domain
MEHEPQITGEPVYRSWDSRAKSLVIGLRITEQPNFLHLDGNFLIIALTRDLALRTWVQKFAEGVAEKPGTDELLVPFITDAYLLRSAGRSERGIWAEIDFLPGAHSLTALLPARPEKCRVDGAQKEVHYDPVGFTSIEISTPALPAKPIDIKQVQFSVERCDISLGKWTSGPSRVLEDLGPVPYGYVKYRAHFSFNGEAMMYISAFTDNDKKVFLNGKYVAQASQPGRFVGFSPAAYVQHGDNFVDIIYELFGSTEFGEEEKMAEINGIASLRLGPDWQAGTSITDWQIQTFPAAMRGRDVDSNFSFGAWKMMSLGTERTSGELVPAFTWCRAEFNLPPADPSWSIPWKLVFGCDRDALFYLNGSFVGRFIVAGPQTDFYLPEPFLHKDGTPNIITVVLAYTESPVPIRILRVDPYSGYAARHTMVEFE